MAGTFPSNVVIDQDRDVFLTVTYKDSTGTPVNLTGYTSQFALASSNQTILSLSSPTSITLNSAGVISIHATSTQTAIPAGQYNAELIVTSGAGVETSILKGNLIVSPAVIA